MVNDKIIITNPTSINRVMYKKVYIREYDIIGSDFIIVNNNKVTCQLNIKDGKILPCLTLRTAEKAEQYTVGLRQAIPDFMSYTVTPKEISVDLITSKFNTDVISDQNTNATLNNILQFSIDDTEDTIFQFNSTTFSPIRLGVENLKSPKMDFEERLYLNFKKGFIFSVVNSEYKLIYCYAKDFRNGIIAHLHGQKDMGPLSRVLKYWPELDIDVVTNGFNIEVQSSRIKQLFPDQDNGIFYLFHRFGTKHLWMNIPYLEV